MSGQRSTPNHCPYCGEEDLRPYEGSPEGGSPEGAPGGHGAWECRNCLRAFRVSQIAQLHRPSVTPAPPTASASSSGSAR